MKSKFSEEQITEQRRIRVRLSLAAYDYEIMNGEIGFMTDDQFDTLCLKVNLECPTENDELDKWWKDNFNPSTGSWIGSHPELSKISKIWAELKDIWVHS